jgi:hypothetical protein
MGRAAPQAVAVLDNEKWPRPIGMVAEDWHALTNRTSVSCGVQSTFQCCCYIHTCRGTAEGPIAQRRIALCAQVSA